MRTTPAAIEPVDFRASLSGVRAGVELSSTQLRAFANGLASGALSDAQAGAFAMAVCVRGLELPQTIALTAAMRDSGRVLDWKPLGVDAPVLDKHSTGGVGDCVSLILAPLLAACGAVVPMVSGRGLGHTGGTLDKLESLPGLSTELSTPQFIDCVRRQGLAIVAANAELAPADRRLYAIRDLSGTVDSVPLIASSILSKKLAAGIGCLLLDLKLGQGALLRSAAEAEELTNTLLRVASALGLGAEVALTDMNQPLADAAGNALELHAAGRVLRGEDRDSRLCRLSLLLAQRLLLRSGLCDSPEQAQFKLRRALDGGAAAARFEAMVVAMGGPPSCLDALPRVLPIAPCIGELRACGDGYVGSIDTRAIGEACLQLGAGRRSKDGAVDPRVGVSDIVELGARVERGQALLRIHAADSAALERARLRLGDVFELVESAPALPALAWGFRELASADAAA